MLILESIKVVLQNLMIKKAINITPVRYSLKTWCYKKNVTEKVVKLLKGFLLMLSFVSGRDTCILTPGLPNKHFCMT